MSIEGNLKDYPFLDVIAMLSNKKETGRLQIDFNSGQGSFYFDKGELSAAQVGALTGFSAINVALSMEGTDFRFDSGIVIEDSHFSGDNERLLLNTRNITRVRQRECCCGRNENGGERLEGNLSSYQDRRWACG